jgi:hypothetical protein
MKKTKFLFDLPVTKDWLFWIFIVFAGANSISSLQGVNQSRGINTSSFSLVSGSIDALVGVLSAYIIVIPIYFIRKAIRKSKN